MSQLSSATREELELIWQYDWGQNGALGCAWDHRWMPWRLAKDRNGDWWLVDTPSGRSLNDSHDLRVLLVQAALLAGGPP